MIAYRDPDFSELETFLKHISIAETLFGVNADLAARLSAVRDPDLEQSYRQTWNDAWEQLAQARTIVVRVGRDPTAIDAERARAGDAIAAFLTGTPIVPATAVKAETNEKTIREHAEVFIETYKPGQKPGERREKRRSGRCVRHRDPNPRASRRRCGS